MGNELREAVRLIKERADIVEIIGRVVPLKRLGASFKACCPFHAEKTPSFNVLPARGRYHCFGCGAGGNAIDFVMAHERLEFIEAVEKLCKEVGIEMPTRRFDPKDGPERDAEAKLRQAAQAANEEALAFYRGILLEGRNRMASDYLPERGITEELSEKFQLGAALEGWDTLRQHMNRAGFSDGLLVEAGLCVKSERGGVYDRFRNRLIFPIFDQNGRVCGFGGRQLTKDENSPKYLNSAETVLYRKSNMLYALNLARPSIEKSGYAILCEGYMDVIMAHAYGYEQAVASLGTALTPSQAKLLKRFASKAFFLYDGDSAGQKAMLRGGESLLAAGLDTRTITLSPEDDPDTFLRREGAAALRPMMDDAREFFDFAMGAHAATLDIETLAGQAELVERLAPIVNAMRNEVMREMAVARMLKKLPGLPREALLSILTRKKAETEKREEQMRGGSAAPERPLFVPDEESRPDGAPPPLDGMERGLLKLMLESAAALGIVRSQLQYDWITDRRLAPWIFHFYDHPGYAETLLDEMDLGGEYPGDRVIVNGILAWDTSIGEDAEASATQLLRRLHERHQKTLAQALLRMIDEHEVSGEAANRLLSALHHENKSRVEHSSRHLRTYDYKGLTARRGRLIDRKPTLRKPPED